MRGRDSPLGLADEQRDEGAGHGEQRRGYQKGRAVPEVVGNHPADDGPQGESQEHGGLQQAEARPHRVLRDGGRYERRGGGDRPGEGPLEES